MNRFWKKLGLRKPDEMERFILFRAQRNAYLFLVAALLCWSLYESCRVYIHHTRLNLLPCLLLGAAALIQSFSQMALTRNAVKDDEDSCETGPLARMVVLACAAAGVLAAAVPPGGSGGGPGRLPADDHRGGEQQVQPHP